MSKERAIQACQDLLACCRETNTMPFAEEDLNNLAQGLEAILIEISKKTRPGSIPLLCRGIAQRNIQQRLEIKDGCLAFLQVATTNEGSEHLMIGGYVNRDESVILAKQIISFTPELPPSPNRIN